MNYIGNELVSHNRERLPASMVPRDEVGLWTILKNCRGKDLSKITFPVVFNEPLSFLQRMAEVFQYAEYLNIADQCDNTVERMEVSTIVSSLLELHSPCSLECVRLHRVSLLVQSYASQQTFQSSAWRDFRV